MCELVHNGSLGERLLQESSVKTKMQPPHLLSSSFQHFQRWRGCFSYCVFVKTWVASKLYMLKVWFSLLKTDYLYLQFHWRAEKSAVSLARLEKFEM